MAIGAVLGRLAMPWLRGLEDLPKGWRRALPLSITAIHFLYEVGSTGLWGRTPVMAVSGIRVVDLATGRPPTWRQSTVRWAVPWLADGLSRPLVRWVTRRGNAELEAVEPERQRVAAKYQDDPQQRALALTALYKDPGVNPMKGCLAASGLETLRVLVLYGTALWDPLRRGLCDRAAGTVVVVGQPRPPEEASMADEEKDAQPTRAQRSRTPRRRRERRSTTPSPGRPPGPRGSPERAA